MAENDFNLGQAMGDYEKANADREFYLSMIQQGQTNRGAFMASPIAAYLAGIAGVKMASMKQQAVEAQQAINDEKQKKEDAQRAAERAIQRGDTLRNNLFQIAKSARNGDIAKGSAGVLAGQIVREMGATPVSFDADNGILTYEYNGDEYELDLNEGYTRKDIEEAKTEREREKAEAAKGRQERGIQGQKEVASFKAGLGIGGGSSQKYTTLSNFMNEKGAHGPVARALNAKYGKERRLSELTKEQVESFIKGAEYLSPNDRQQVQGDIDILTELSNKKGWTLGSNNLESMWDNL